MEEYLFLVSNMDVVIRMKDAELVGEFLQALHILDTPHDHPAMQKGYHFLIGAEKKGKMRGNWVPSSAPFYQRYHAAYCGIIGLAEFVFDPTESVKHRNSHLALRAGMAARPDSAFMMLIYSIVSLLAFLCVCRKFPHEWAKYFE